jgi:hypothetical protein
MLCLPIHRPESHGDYLFLLSMLADVVPLGFASGGSPAYAVRAALLAVARGALRAAPHTSSSALAGMTGLLAAPSASDEEAGAPEWYLPAFCNFVVVGVRAESLEDNRGAVAYTTERWTEDRARGDRSQGCQAEAVVVAASLAIFGQDMQVARSRWT